MQRALSEESINSAKIVKKVDFLWKSGGRLPTRATKIQDEIHFKNPNEVHPFELSSLPRVRSSESPRRIAERVFSPEET